MTVGDWLRKFMASGPSTMETAPMSPPITQPRQARAGKDDVIAYAVNLSGLVSDQPEAMAFYLATFADHPSRFVTYDDLRKQGDLLDKDALKALGLRSNVKLSAQFFGTLNQRGRADPLGAAGVIGLAISKALGTLRDLGKMEAAGIDMAKFHASNMAAGPCAAAAKLDGQTVPVFGAEMLPFETCPHPDQCACRYQAWLSILDD